MDSLPVVVVRQISEWLEPKDLINLAFTCFPQSSFLRVSVSNCPTRGSFSKGETALTVCQCPDHGTTDLMRDMLPLLFSGLDSLELEDDLVREKMTDDVVFALLTKFSNVPLTSIQLELGWVKMLMSGLCKLRRLFESARRIASRDLVDHQPTGALKVGSPPELNAVKVASNKNVTHFKKSPCVTVAVNWFSRNFRLVLSRCDLSNVRPWTLSLIAKMEQLKELVVDSCQLPVTESLFLRSIAASFPTLVTVELTQNKKVGAANVKDSGGPATGIKPSSSLSGWVAKLCGTVPYVIEKITDNMALVLSRNCPHLESFSVTGCPLVSVRSLLHLMSSVMLRMRPILTVNLEKTAFCADQLFRYIYSPLFEGSASDWIVRRTSVDLGFEKRALLAEHINSLCIVVYD